MDAAYLRVLAAVEDGQAMSIEEVTIRCGIADQYIVVSLLVNLKQLDMIDKVKDKFAITEEGKKAIQAEPLVGGWTELEPDLSTPPTEPTPPIPVLVPEGVDEPLVPAAVRERVVYHHTLFGAMPVKEVIPWYASESKARPVRRPMTKEELDEAYPLFPPKM